jgi:hypothetical protein
VQRDSDEDAWRAIVDNYGERIELDDESSAEPASEPAVEPDEKQGYDAAGGAGLQRLFRPLPEPQPETEYLEDELEDEDEDDFVPPTPPPLPKLSPDRLLAWVGLFGSPTVLLVCLVLGIHLVPWMAYLLVASFIGGFGYLVVQMPRNTDIDPWDDGARL